MTRIQCNRCGNYKDEIFIHTDRSGESYCGSCKSAIQKQKQKQESAFEMELAISTFHNMLEPLEEYIGKIGCYPDWNNRRQLYRNTIKDSNDTTEGFEDLFLTQLLIVTGVIGKKPADFRKEVQKEYGRWISAVGIDENNIPPQAEKLRHYLFEINEVLEGRGEKIFNQTKELVKGQNISSQDALWFTSASQGYFNRSDERKKVLKGKKFNELRSESRFGAGDEKKGEQSIGRIAGTVADKHKNFRFYPQKPQQIRNPNYNPLLDDPSEEFLSSEQNDMEGIESSSSASSKNQQNNPQQGSWWFSNKSEKDLRNLSASTTPKNDDKGIGKGGIIAIFGISVLLISGVVVLKKRLNKNKK